MFGRSLVTEYNELLRAQGRDKYNYIDIWSNTE